MDLQLFVTLSPSMPHFLRFVRDNRIAGIRINSAMMYANEIEGEMKIVEAVRGWSVPLYFDVKARQLRITKVTATDDHLEVRINHPIEVELPTPVLFKAGEDSALLVDIKERDCLVFAHGGPYYNVKEGESIHIRHPSLKMFGGTFPEYELEKIARVRPYFNRWVISYVEGWNDLKAFRDIIPSDPVGLKIENKRGLSFVKDDWFTAVPDGLWSNTFLIAAQGDLYVECDKPHEMLGALKMIAAKDTLAWAGSRMLLSCVNQAVPSAADFAQLAWLYDCGYRKFLLCDDLCIDGDRLTRAINVFEAFRNYYPGIA